MKTLSILFIILCFFRLDAKAQITEALIHVSVSADNTIETVLESHISRQIRSFENADVLGYEGADYLVNVVVLQANGYIASVVIEKKLWPGSILFYFDKNVDNYDFIEGMINFTVDGYTSTYYHGVMTDSSIESLSNRIVAMVDVEVIEFHREAERIIRRVNNN